MIVALVLEKFGASHGFSLLRLPQKFWGDILFFP